MIDLDTFGARFGALVKTKRGLNGWSQERLAREIWTDAARKSHVSKLERGGIPNPQANTIDEYANALNISGAEVDVCRTPPALPVVEDGTEGLPLILENLALRFGIENPDASTDEKAAYLRDKARDYQAMQDRLAALGRAEGNIANLIGAAQAALAADDFDEADARLADAEDMQQTEKTLVEVRKQATIRVQRGDALLLKDDAAGAAAHFEAAAAMFDAFEPEEGAQQRYYLEDRLYQHCLRFGGEGFTLSEALLRKALSVWAKEESPTKWAKAQNSLAINLSNQAARVEGKAGAALLAEAVTAYRAALEVRTRADHPVNWAMTQNNLADALSNQAARVAGEAGAALLAQAVTACRAALEVRTRADHPVQWAMTQENVAYAYEAWAELASDEAEEFLQAALAAVDRSLEVYDPEHMSLRFNAATRLRERIAAKLDALPS